MRHTAGHGANAVLIVAETPSSGPVNLAGEVVRDRAVIVAVGTVGMDIQRKLYYEKELDFRIARSYGPGRYDTAYEQKGRRLSTGVCALDGFDLEHGSLPSAAALLVEGRLDLKSLITHRFSIEQANGAYDLITGKTASPILAC